MASWHDPIKPDDFIVAIGKTNSNSVYHVISVRVKEITEKRKIRCHVEVYISDLTTCLKRDQMQKLIPIAWYSRDKKETKQL